MNKETITKIIVKILVSIAAIFILTHSTLNESKRKRAGKTIISLILFFLLLCLALFVGWFGFFAGLLLIWFIHKEMNHETATK